MRVGSLFAGIGGFDLAAERVGMEVVFQSENDPKASAVLDHHWPEVPNYGDIHDIRVRRPEPAGLARSGGDDSVRPGLVGLHLPSEGDTNAALPGVDVLTGGFPCQDYSVAGLRGGLAGDRGALWWEYHRLITELRPTWVIGENVPGLLSSRDGADFETIVGSLTECGYGVAWAVLDAQYFGVAQRRRRVFIVGHSGGIPRPEILALSEGLFGHPEPSRTTGQDVAGTLAPSSARGGQRSIDLDGHGAWVLQPDDANLGRGGLRALPVDKSPTLGAYDPNHSDRGAMVFAQNQRDEVRDLGDLAGGLQSEPGMKQQTYVAKTSFTGSNGWGVLDDGSSHTLDSSGPEAVISTASVRRLTPLECERLQGFPDGWTDIPGNSDTQRYRQLGNAVAVPVVEWIMQRIMEV